MFILPETMKMMDADPMPFKLDWFVVFIYDIIKAHGQEIKIETYDIIKAHDGKI